MERELLSVLSTLCPREMTRVVRVTSQFDLMNPTCILMTGLPRAPILVNGSQRSFALKSFLKTSGNTESCGDVT